MNWQSLLEPAFIGVVVSLAGLVAGSYASKAPAAEKLQLFIPRQAGADIPNIAFEKTK